MVRFVLICDFERFSPLWLVKQAKTSHVPQNGSGKRGMLLQASMSVPLSCGVELLILMLASTENTQEHTYRFASTNPQGDSSHTDNQG